MKIDQITLRAEAQDLGSIPQSADANMTLQQSFRVSGATRAAADTHVIKLTGESVIELVYSDDTTWFCSPDTLTELYPEMEVQRRAVGEAFEYELPAVLQAGAQDRGIVQDITLKVVNIFAKKKIKSIVGGKVKDLATDLEKKQLEQQSGLYRITDRDFNLEPFKGQGTRQPYLLFLHGTASSTKGSFKELAGTDVWPYVEQAYGANILAFQHESLTKSPLHNVAELVEALPNNSTLHVISHSRGGLVGDILSRFCISDESNRGFTKAETDLLRKADRDQAAAIRDTLKRKKIAVKKFIRVACPSQGTTLASKRLDNYFNALFNLIGYGTGISASPIYMAFRNLIVAVLDSKNDSDLLPGIEAMNPDSPFVKALNHLKSPVVADDALMVISGNAQVNLSGKGLLVIISKLFYLHKNDLVVDTESMYGGTTRSHGVQYFFDEGPEVDHFHYFKNERTSAAILQGLKADDTTALPGFGTRTLLLEEASRNALLKAEGGQVFKDTVTGTRPIVVILPGIMGSSLALDDEPLWVNYFQFLSGGLGKLDLSTKNITAPALVRTSYEKLVLYLGDKYDVVTFPYDWRLSLLSSADVFKDKIETLLEYKQPIRIIAHSMGGVLVRDFIIRHQDTWKALNNTSGFRLIFLGAPLRGSFRIPAVFFGEDDLIDKLARIDLTRNKASLLKIFNKFPGMLGLLPIANGFGGDFLTEETWETLRAACGDSQWPIPPKETLRQLISHRDKIEAALESAGSIDYTNISYIAGKDKATACGYRIDTLKDGTKELVFLSTAEGDQSVTWESGIPRKMIEQNAVYYVDVTHGALANEPSIFNGIADILSNGKTTLLSKVRPSVRGEEKLFRSPKTVDYDLSERGVENTILGLPADGPRRTKTKSMLRVSVVRGDLKFATYPVLAGHFDEDGILYAEKAINRYLNGALDQRHQLGLYPGKIGTNEVLLSDDEHFKGAVIVGLGASNELTAYELTLTIEQGIAKYLLLLNDNTGNGNGKAANIPPGISSLIIGCGYGGLSVESAVRAILQGISNANDKIMHLYGTEARLLEFVEFIEQYDERSLTCLYAINKLQSDPALKVSVSDNKIIGRLGGRDRLPVDMTADWWTRITVYPDVREENNKKIRTLRFNVSTGGAQEKQRDVHTSQEIIDQLVDDISMQNHWTPALAKTLFELLVPNDFKEQIKKQGNIVWVLDETTASIPWELLHDNTDGTIPLSANGGMIRQMMRSTARAQIKTIRNSRALVVGDPDLKGFVNQLPGAYREGEKVAKLLAQEQYDVTSLLKKSPPEIIEALFSSDYKIIHLAGHGIFNSDPLEPSGMVIGNGVFLSSREIAQMSNTPELVFVNCCFLGQTDGIAEEFFRNRYKLAANLGTQLIDNGVKAVVVAGWAVDDAAALEFARDFYTNMLAGDTFGSAVQKARRNIYQKYSRNNTWGAYQCYGDPFYRLTTHTRKKSTREYSFVIPKEAEVELFNLRSEIEMGSLDVAEAKKRLEAVGKAVDGAGIRTAAVTELEAMIYVELYDYDAAIAKFESLLNMENAAFSVVAMEKYCNIRAKKFVADLLELLNDGTKTAEQKNRKRRSTGNKMKEVISDLNGLLTLGKTAERLGLMGSTYKRLSIVAENRTAKLSAYKEAAAYYQQAHAFKSNVYKVYTLTNWLAIESLLIMLKQHHWGQPVRQAGNNYTVYSEKEAMEELERLKTEIPPPENMSYWQYLSVANMAFTQFLLERLFHPTKKHSVSYDNVVTAYRKAWKRTSSEATRMAEIEHFDFLIDGYALSNTTTAKAITKEITRLRSELVKQI
jgi:CHAT domain-containing protein